MKQSSLRVEASTAHASLRNAMSRLRAVPCACGCVSLRRQPRSKLARQASKLLLMERNEAKAE